MTTATAVKAAPPKPAAPPPKVLFQGLVPLDKIDIVANVRAHFDEAKLKELAENIDAIGVSQPILLRPGKPGRFELVAGERRFRAARLAGLKEIPAIVKELTEEQVQVAQLVENIQREDLTPIEEARAYRKLADTGKYTVEQLAALVKKSVRNVYRAMALMDLPKPIMVAIDTGELTPAHGQQLLRVSAEDRPAIAKKIKKDTTAAALGELIEEHLGSSLKSAGWDLEAPFAGKPACAGCPFNSANQGKLVDGVAGGRCTNKPCFEVKTMEIDRRRASGLQAQFPGVKLVPPAQEYTVEQRYKVTDVPQQIASTKEMKDAIRAKPDNYLLCMVEDSEWSGDRRVQKLVPRVFVKISAHSEVLKVMGKSHPDAYKFGGGSMSQSGGVSGESAEKRFARQDTERRILDEIAAAAAKIEKKHWVAIAIQLYNANCPKHILETAGVDFSGSGGYGNGLYKALEPLSLEKLQVMSVQMSLWSYGRGQHETGWREPKLRSIGLDAPKVVAKAKAAAAAAWKAKKAKRK